MLQRILDAALANRIVVLLGAAMLMVVGVQVTRQMSVDVFPDLTAPAVTIMTEAHGLGAGEVEQLVTFPVETAMNGAPSVRRIRSSSAAGISIVWVEFDWETDVYRARQLVNERLTAVRASLPPSAADPTMAPISSIMGEVMLVALEGEGTSLAELRALADWELRPRLMSLGGVANVSVLGGELQQLQVQVNPLLLEHHGVELHAVMAAVEGTQGAAGGGVLSDYGNQYSVRAVGRVRRPEALERAIIPGTALRIEDVAEVKWGGGDPIGAGSCNGKEAVILTVSKQPDVNTLELTERLDAAIGDLALSLPDGVSLRSDVFRQSDFIEVSIENLQRTLLEGAFFVILVLLVFLMNWRTTLISLLAIPLSLLTSILVLNALGYDVNTMSLGGMAIAIGALVDDAIIDVENVYKRLRMNRHLPPDKRLPLLEVVRGASMEIRSSILVATLIIMVSFVPLFFLSGMEGRLLQPLGIAFLTSVMASLLVAVTVTPVMCSYLLGSERSLNRSADGTRLERWLARTYRASLKPILRRPLAVVSVAVALLVAALVGFFQLGQTFLPPFNEGSLVISLVGPPGMSLEESERAGRQAEALLLAMPEVDVVTRRTGRAELDEHAQGVNASELDVPFTLADPSMREAFFNRVRQVLGQIPGINATLGQPIAHRIDHMLSGTRANIAVKLYGDELPVLQALSREAVAVLEGIDGLADVTPEPMMEVPEVRITPRPELLAAYGLSVSDVGHFVETAVGGEALGEAFLGSRRRADIVVRLAPAFRSSIDALRALNIPVAGGGSVPLSAVADVESKSAAFTVSRENVQRKAVIAVNLAGRDLGSAVAEIQSSLRTALDLPPGYRFELGGQFESAERAAGLLKWSAILAVLVIFFLLYMEFRNLTLASIVLLNLPLALIGGIAAVALTSGSVSIAAVIGFISLFGMATRNGLLLVSRYEDLAQTTNLAGETLLLQGAADRLNPILMTALSTALALIPLALNGDASGNEIQSPMAVVILGGLLSATLLNLYVIPIIYRWVRMR